MLKSRHKLQGKARSQTFNRLIPNIITVGALCAGLTAVRFAISEQWEFAMIAIVVAAILDALDGTIARLLKASSNFGAELDSLSDVIAFGVAPGLIIYFWRRARDLRMTSSWEFQRRGARYWRCYQF